MLLCLNSEWQGCESPELERGSRLLAAEVFEDSPYVDFGSSECGDLSVRAGVFALDCVSARFAHVLDELRARAPKRVFTIGGTCGSEAAPVAYLAARHDHLGVVWFDAHGDLNTPASSPSGHFHGMVLRSLLGEGPAALTARMEVALDPGKVVIAGARDLDVPERDYIALAGIGLIEGWPEAMAQRIEGLLRASGVESLYIHIDVDVIDPLDFGDALFSVPGGPSLHALAATVRELVGSFDVVGVGVVESCGRMPGAASSIRNVLVDSALWIED